MVAALVNDYGRPVARMRQLLVLHETGLRAGELCGLRFCFDDQGNQLPQTSSSQVIARMLRLLGVRQGDRVLEIGTGSGYSTALLAELTGPSGTAVSIDVDPELAERTKRLLVDGGYRNVHLLTADGSQGWPTYAPYDRVIAWCSVTAVPPAWREQTRPGTVLVIPMRTGHQQWVSTYHRSERSSLVEDERVDGGFIPLTRTPFRPWEDARS
jgi:protein-L-isoaspartate(D-aspartate) O-methyltransferase